jgi:3-oxoacyl-[acyl-carrier protein] reductase
MKFEGSGHEKKRVIVLGGASGIGEATARRFAKEGWSVLVGSQNYDKARKVVDGLEGCGHGAYKVDVRNDEDIQKFSGAIKESFGGVRALVNSVGISQGCHVLDSDFSCWDNSLQVMLYGTVKTCRALIPLLSDFGRIVQITSIHHDRVENGSSAYGMAKAAITQFTRSLALELAPRNILANAIAPGFINTPMSIKANGVNEMDTEWFRDNYIKYDHLPLKRAGGPEEVAGVAFFLAGPDASYITGSVITVDGGLTITF